MNPRYALLDEKSVTATVTTDGKSETLEAEVLLVAVGRGPVTEGAGLEAAGVLRTRGSVDALHPRSGRPGPAV